LVQNTVKDYSNYKCYECSQYGHIAINCPKQNSSSARANSIKVKQFFDDDEEEENSRNFNNSSISNSQVDRVRGDRNSNPYYANQSQINTANVFRLNCLSVLQSNTVSDSVLVHSDDSRPSEMAILESGSAVTRNNEQPASISNIKTYFNTNESESNESTSNPSTSNSTSFSSTSDSCLNNQDVGYRRRSRTIKYKESKSFRSGCIVCHSGKELNQHITSVPHF